MIRSLIKDSSIYSLGDFIFRLVAFATFPIYAYVFTVEEFGVMALIISLTGLIASLANLGMNNSVQRFYWDPETRDGDRKKIISSGLWVLAGWASAVIALLLAGLYFQKEFLFQNFDLAWIWVVLGLVTVVPSQIIDYAQNVLRLYFAPWKFTFVSACRNAMGVGLGLFFVLVLHWGVAGVFWGNLLAMVLAVPICLWLIRKDLALTWDTRWCRELFRFGYPFIYAGLAYWVFGLSDRWMLGALTDNTQVGLYSIAYKIASILIFINQAFGMAWSPLAFRLYGENPEYRAIFGRILSYLLFGMVLLGTAVTLFSTELLILLSPGEYWEASSFVGYLVMGMVFLGTTQITAMGITLEKRPHLISRASWMAAVLNVILNFLLIPAMGAKGAALATFISYIFLTGYYLSWTQRIHPIVLEYKKLVLSLALIPLTLVFFSFIGRTEWDPSVFAFKVVFLGLILVCGFAGEIVKTANILKLVPRKAA
ncbi:MAG: flippase [Nitrospinaceae bacterium]